jgi:hypothetical protein
VPQLIVDTGSIGHLAQVVSDVPPEHLICFSAWMPTLWANVLARLALKIEV